MKKIHLGNKVSWLSRIIIPIFLILMITTCRHYNVNQVILHNNLSTSTPVLTTVKPIIPTVTISPNKYPIGDILTNTLKTEFTWHLLLNGGEPAITSDHTWLAIPLSQLSESDENLPLYHVNVWIMNTSNSQGFFLYPDTESLMRYPFIIFSPDGKFMAISSFMNIQLFSTDSWEKVIEITVDRNNQGIYWSPQSDILAIPNNVFINPDTGTTFPSEKNAPILSIKKIDGTEITSLLVSDVYPYELPYAEVYSFYSWGPTWSPDGEYFAYIKYYINHGLNVSAEKSELWIQNIATEKNTKLYEKNGFLTNPIWSTDGNKISFVSFDYDTNRDILQVFDIPQNNIISFPGVDGLYIQIPYSPVWSPDSQEISVFLQTEKIYSEKNVTRIESEDKGIYILNIDNGVFTFFDEGFVLPIAWTNENYLFTYRMNENVISLRRIPE